MMECMMCNYANFGRQHTSDECFKNLKRQIANNEKRIKELEATEGVSQDEIDAALALIEEE